MARTAAFVALIALAACTNTGGSNQDFSLADLAGADLTGSPPPDFSGPVTITPTSAVTIIVEPGDNGDMMVAAINGAATSVHVTMYQLTSSRVINALKARKAAGVEVKVLLNQTFPGGMGSNASVYSELMAANVSVKYAPSTFQYTHEKAMVIDNKTAWIMTMNASDSAMSGNREFLAVDTDADDVAETEAIFAADFGGMAITPTGKLLVAPVNAEPQINALIDLATTTVDLEGEVLSADSVLQALGRAKNRGCSVRVVLSDQTPTSAGMLAITELKQASIPVRSVSNPYIHSKAIVVDNKLAYVGSENFTQNSLESNRELGVIIDATSEIAKVETAINSDFNAGTNL